MRLARLAVAGLAFGVIAGFATALLRPRPLASPPLSGSAFTDPATDTALWAQFEQAEQSSALDPPARRPVTG